MGIDIGKFFTRILTPSERQIQAIQALTPTLSPIIGAISGNQQLTQAGLSMYSPQSATAYAQSVGTGVYSAEYAAAMANLGMSSPFMGGIPSVLPGQMPGAAPAGGAATLFIVVIGAAVYFLAT